MNPTTTYCLPTCSVALHVKHYIDMYDQCIVIKDCVLHPTLEEEITQTISNDRVSLQEVGEYREGCQA